MNCNHKNYEVMCWQWTGFPGKDTFIAMECKCNDCQESFVRFMRHCMEHEYKNFITKYSDKEAICIGK